MATYFTADTHFGHDNIVTKFSTSRPFASIQEHDEVLIANWNETVSPNDEVYHLGDLAYRCHPRQMREVFDRLNRVKHLVMGNHDTGATKSMPWASVHELAQVAVDGRHLVLCHYSLRVWPGMHAKPSRRPAIHLYGHSHGSLAGCELSADVGGFCRKFSFYLPILVNSRRPAAVESTA
ncbi:metallophosphoesterase family protein [Microvirga sp. P5_D2]